VGAVPAEAGASPLAARIAAGVALVAVLAGTVALARLWSGQHSAIQNPPPSQAHFATLSPGTPLPTGAQCAALTRRVSTPENKGINKPFNQVTGHPVGNLFPAADNPSGSQELVPRIDGQFTGTTGQILRWAACKWGIDEDLVAAQAAVESWWRQTNLGDWGTDPRRCPPGHDLGVDGNKGHCPESYGILQNRYPLEQSTWPGIARSTAMNADVAYAIWRACFEGYERWLNDVERVGQYAPGDAWGCIGRWFAGRWHTAAAEQYIVKVKEYLSRKVWLNAGFQEP